MFHLRSELYLVREMLHDKKPLAPFHQDSFAAVKGRSGKVTNNREVPDLVQLAEEIEYNVAVELEKHKLFEVQIRDNVFDPVPLYVKREFQPVHGMRLELPERAPDVGDKANRTGGGTGEQSGSGDGGGRFGAQKHPVHTLFSVAD